MIYPIESESICHLVHGIKPASTSTQLLITDQLNHRYSIHGISMFELQAKNKTN